MKKLLFPSFLLSLLLLLPLGVPMTASSAMAQSPLDGTWKIDMNKVDFSKKPDVFLLADGWYDCKTCTPPYRIKADGMDQAVTGHPYFDSVAVKVVNDHEVQETDKKGGKVVATSTTIISPDGKTATFTFSDASDTNGGAPVTGKGESMLVTKGPAGSHAISGSWRMAKMDSLSDNATVWTYKVSGGSLTMTSKSGQSYTAKLDGSDAPMMGDPGVTSVQVKMLGKNVIEETDKRNGKVIGVFKVTVGPDGKTAKAIYSDELAGKSTTYDVVKQ